MNSSVTIQRLRDNEAARLRRLRLRALSEAPYAFGSTLDENLERPMSRWEEQVRNLPTFVAVRDGADVGMVRTAPHDEDPGTAFLLSMWVSPEARGRGIGERLVTALVDFVREEGFERIVLDVGDANEHAIHLYERLGFEPTGDTATLPAPREDVTEHRRVLELA